MPTLQDEMNKVLTEWNKSIDTEEKLMTIPTKPKPLSLTRATFEHIKANPGVTAKEASGVLEKLGHNPSSVIAIMAHFARSNLCRKENGKYFVVSKTYTPPKVVVKRRKVAQAPLSTAVFASPTITSAVADVRKLPVSEAHALYLALHEFFGAPK